MGSCCKVILIAGAGPTGLALAAQVHAHGGHVRIVERRSEIVCESRALVVQPRTLEVLQPLGVAQALMARGRSALDVQLHVGRRAPVSGTSGSPVDPSLAVGAHRRLPCRLGAWHPLSTQPRHQAGALLIQVPPACRAAPAQCSCPRDGVACWLHEALVPVGFHLLLCGPADSWDEGALEVVRERYGHLMTIHRLTRDGLPGMLQDEDGRALARLGAGRRGVRHYLVRPDGYVAFGSKAADFRGLQAQLPCWLAVPGRY